MAGLMKPDNCPTCGSKELHREWHPERWVCDQKHVVISRKQLSITGICRVCGRSKDEVEFANHGNICKECKSKYHKDYCEENKETLAQKHRDSYQANKKQRQEAVKTAVQRSPEAFIRHLLHHVTKNCNFRRVNLHKLNPASLDVDIDYEYLINLYKEQKGLCAISQMPMVHHWGDPSTISIDRIDSNKGYLKGNVHLVCQWINIAKNKHSVSEIQTVLDLYFFERLKRLSVETGQSILTAEQKREPCEQPQG